jgi:hypothetical protein
MARDIPVADWPVKSVKLHPELEAFLQEKSRVSGRSLEAEIVQLVGEAMEAAEIPTAPSNTPFVCNEDLMAQKAECRDCHEVIRHNARLWAERHVQQTGHNVRVSLYFDLRDEGWLERLPRERRAEIEDLVQNPDKARALAGNLLTTARGQKVN